LFESKLGKEAETKKNNPGTVVMIFKIFSPKKMAKISAFFAQTTVWPKNTIFEVYSEKFRRNPISPMTGI
jgi:hypothetical protein